ncbi:hypothetical protein [Mycobacterium sp. NPDC006124]|uniref:hypothetical protein n=1 Tax=Mycobacterium sp. NPDC006124 TaxID=3156729 RepID=UPI0033AE5873
MDQRERALLAGLPGAGYTAGIPGWNGLWQNAVGTRITEVELSRGEAATIRAELTR